VVLTRHGHPAVRLVPAKQALSRDTRMAQIEEIQASARPTPGPCAARSRDFLYGEDGLPQ
jgi:antitoxin (DNA-binding transcriptional repressor) of toxin-antitoxin stability system